MDYAKIEKWKKVLDDKLVDILKNANINDFDTIKYFNEFPSSVCWAKDYLFKLFEMGFPYPTYIGPTNYGDIYCEWGENVSCEVSNRDILWDIREKRYYE